MRTEDHEPRADGYSASDILSPVAEKRTYKNLVYLLLAFPLGFAYYMLLLFGFAFGAILSVLLIGVVILLVTILGSRVLAAFERWLANALLELDLQPYEDVDRDATSSAGLVTTIRRYLAAASTWRGLGFLMLKLWVGIVGLVLVILLLSALSVLTAPLHYPYEAELITINDEPIAWTIDTLPEALVAVPIGAVLSLAALHVVNAVASVVERMAMALLGEPAAELDSDAGATTTTPDPGAESTPDSGPDLQLPANSDSDSDPDSESDSKANSNAHADPDRTAEPSPDSDATEANDESSR